MPESPTAKAISPEEAARIAQDVYGLEVSARPLPGEYDHNFHAVRRDGKEYVLKVMHSSRDAALIDLMCQALRHLAEHAPELTLPRVQPTQGAELFTKVKGQDGAEHLVWLLSFLPGKELAAVRPHSEELLHEIGRLLGNIDRTLLNFSHRAAQRELKWDSARALWIRDVVAEVFAAQSFVTLTLGTQINARRAMVERAIAHYEQFVSPLIAKLRKSVIYGDANEHNVLVNRVLANRADPSGAPGGTKNGHTSCTVSVIDFGDMHHGWIASEPAIAAAYAMLGKDDPLAAAATVVKGFHEAFPLNGDEIAALYSLIEMRLAVSVVNSAQRKALFPKDAYITISEAPAWAALERMQKIHPRFAHYAFRNACGLSALPQAEHLRRWLADAGKTAAPVLDEDLRTAPCHVIDLSVGSTFLGADPANAETATLSAAIDQELQRRNVKVGVGRYDEARPIYTSALFGNANNPTEERRTIHLGIDLFEPSGANVHAPLEGVVHAVGDNNAPLDYGPVVILKHAMDNGSEFFTLYGHLSRESIAKLSVGQRVKRGEVFVRLGNAQENGGWPPHLHFQIIGDLLEMDRDFPGVAKASEREIWKSLSPDPNLLLGIPAGFPRETSAGETLVQRRALLGRNLSISYQHPLKIVRGWRQHLYDDTGRAYLDVYNNVPLVGHSHPRVVSAVQQQLGLLNTNTRYLHDNAVEYARRLTEKMPEPLRVCYFVNSGSEANELALRLARTHTGQEDVVVLEHAYHGHTSTLIDISPYKFDGPGGSGRKSWVHVAPLADDYRGKYRRGEKDLGPRYAQHVADIMDGLRAQGRGAAAYIAETMPSVGGQIVFPADYLKEVYRHVRTAGGVCIADEVQVGFGRMGTHFWGFETQGVVPDIVVLGKPIGNAFPLAAVITTAEIAASFDNGMEFFSTFGGNPVSCAAGLAVLDIVEEERLQQNALAVGNYWMAGLRELQTRHPLIGDVRGSGLFLGLDLVHDRETRRPATEQAYYVANRLRDCGILTGTDGPHHNVIKLRPPLIFSTADADLFVKTLDFVLGEDAAQPL